MISNFFPRKVYLFFSFHDFFNPATNKSVLKWQLLTNFSERTEQLCVE